ncbi:pilus assembly protein PilP [Halomonas sp. I1]|uniref:pilus assembly protein PilP n=1 Tax=Halomonas sp. I1 TaxID=393536 RepID=UPI0028DD7AD3|nr:pilus assembly protein PilP [Halomonas sp. I1]MDT8894440.1 pilus assembly protein PilP [Halomonas sp. I1]
MMGRRRVGALWLAMLMAGCQDAGLEALEKRLVAWRDDAVAPPMEEPSPASRPVSADYRLADSRDPFSLIVPKAGRIEGNAVSVRGGARPALEGHALETLDLVGTLHIAGKSWALMKTPEGRVRRVGVGDHLRPYRGRVVSVAGTAIHLVERRPDGKGGWNERDVTLRLDD